jgi:hypothetical protein
LNVDPPEFKWRTLRRDPFSGSSLV